MLAVVTTEMQPSRRLPPPEAWKEPERYIDLSTGLALPGVEKIELPTDSRGFVMPHKAIRYVLDSFFRPDYRWTIDYNDDELKPDDHHFHYDAARYSAESNNGDTVPSIFRELATLIGRMPRQLHNVTHDFTIAPEMPSRQDMLDYIEAYHTALRMLIKVVDSARLTSKALDNFPVRRLTVAKGIKTGKLTPKDELDSYGEEFMRSFFDEHFQAYSQALASLRETDPAGLEIMMGEELSRLKDMRLRPRRAVKLLGGFVNRKSVDYMPMILRAAA